MGLNKMAGHIRIMNDRLQEEVCRERAQLRRSKQQVCRVYTVLGKVALLKDRAHAVAAPTVAPQIV